MAAAFEFSGEGMEKHTCRTWREGDWIIMQCPQCRFLRRMNWKTGRLHLDQAGDDHVLHTAMHRPATPELSPEAWN